ncbi:MAG: helix-turn-helix transcriptional regulator [Clostridia bacterium]|nr:helix-turn-helix transcriptional regulator [Clostridia bacterium]
MKLLTHYLNDPDSALRETKAWREHFLNDSLYYSFRDTRYDRQTFPSSLHYHDYFELVIVEAGNIHYLCGSASIKPQAGDIILIPPQTLHMSVIDGGETRYIRHVFYFYPDALDPLGCSALLPAGPDDGESRFIRVLGPMESERLLTLLRKLGQALSNPDPIEQALSKALTIEAFYLIGKAAPGADRPSAPLPPRMRELQAYIDAHYQELQSVEALAERFYYSREYLSRLFRRYLNTTVADYIAQLRVLESQRLIRAGVPLKQVCFQVGFGSMSTFIRAFRSVTKTTPSEYRKELSGI